MKSNPSIEEQLREVIGNALGYAVMNPDFTDDEIIELGKPRQTTLVNERDRLKS